MEQGWILLHLRADLPRLYNSANSEGALETQTIDFWSAVLEAFIQCQPYALTMTSQAPPDANPQSEFRRRRIDLSIAGYTAERRERLFIILVEAKGAHNRRYIEVETQAQGACEDYLNAYKDIPLIYAVCAVGTTCRVFQYNRRTDWTPMFGNNEEYDSSQYIDAADPRSHSVWKALETTVDMAPTQLAGKDYLRPNPPTAKPAPSGPSASVYRQLQATSSQSQQQQQQQQQRQQQQQSGEEERIVAAYVRLRRDNLSHEQALQQTVLAYCSQYPVGREAANTYIAQLLNIAFPSR